MAFLPLRQIELNPATTRLYDEWLAALDAALAAPGADWYRIARDTLFDIYYPGHADYSGMAADPKLSPAARAALATFDAHNITLEPEYYADADQERFARVKPLLWLWYSFDRSPLGGQNVHLGVRLRRLLAPRIFARCGENFKCFQNVEFSFGYNMDVGDHVVVHRHVLLDDRGGLTLGNRVSTFPTAHTSIPTPLHRESCGCHHMLARCWRTMSASPTTPRSSLGSGCGATGWWERWLSRPRTCGRTTSM